MSQGITVDLGFGEFTGWMLQSVSAPEVSRRAQEFSKTGNEQDSNLFDRRKNYTCTYKAARNCAATAPTIPPNIGAVINDIVLLGIQIDTTMNQHATMTLTGHQHMDGATDGTTLRSIAHGITLSKGFGAHAFGAVAGGNSIVSGSCSITCEHDETPDESGNTAQGENHDPKIEITVGMMGKLASGDVTVTSGYDLLELGPNEQNTEFAQTDAKVYKALAFSEA